MTRRARRALARTALGAVLPWCGWGCSPDLALGEVSAREQSLDEAPLAEPTAAASPLTDESPVPGPDFAISPRLEPPDVTLRIDAGVAEVALSGVGDLDGDGFDDFAIEGADYTNGVAFVHLRYGGPRPAGAGGAFALEQSGARLVLGPFLRNAIEVIQPAGDVDGDGFGDLLIGLTRCHPAESTEGAYLLYGGSERLSGVLQLDDAAVRLRDPGEPAPSDQSSCGAELDPHLAALGDVDGDGFDDFVIADQRSAGVSTAYLFYGAARRLTGEHSLLAADARFELAGAVVPTATGDLNADGTYDLILSVYGTPDGADRSILLPGSRERRQGAVDVASAGIALGTLFPFTTSGSGLPRPTLNAAVLSPPDVDGEGTADLVVWSHAGTSHLFYGGPRLFSGGVDLAQSVALDNDAGLSTDLWFAGDRDGDGDSELVARFYQDLNEIPNDVALVGGTRQRASSSLLFPVQAVLQANPKSALVEDSRFLECLASAGDVDGDGAADLLTTSTHYLAEGNETDGYIFTASEPQLHIHYGVPGSGTPPVR